LKRKFITNLGFLLTLNIIIKPLYVFGIDRVVQNKVGAEVYGNYFYMFNIALIFQILLDLGIENFIRREIAQYPHLVSKYLSNIILLKCLLGILFFLVCFAIALGMGINTIEIPLLLLILLNQFIASFILYLRANLGGLQLFKTESIISVLDRTVLILVVGYLLLNPETSSVFKIKWFVLAQTFAYTISLIVSFIIVFKKSEPFKVEINLLKNLAIIKRLVPYATLVLLMALYYRVDSLLLVKLLPDGDEQAGIYAHAFRILDFLSNYALLFPILLLPIFSKTIHQKQQVDGLLNLSTFLLIVPSVSMICPAIIYRKDLFDLLYNEHIIISADTFAILTISYFGMCISYTFGALLTANGNLRQLNIMAAIAVVISLTLNLILVPHLKVIGAAIANASAQFFTIAFQIILASKTFKLKLNVNTLIRFAGFLLSLGFAGWVLHTMQINWITGFIAISSFGMIIAFVTGLINIRGMLAIIRQQKF
jgi:O-antigen/teichoic acid export membrane protein